MVHRPHLASLLQSGCRTVSPTCRLVHPEGCLCAQLQRLPTVHGTQPILLNGLQAPRHLTPSSSGISVSPSWHSPLLSPTRSLLPLEHTVWALYMLFPWPRPSCFLRRPGSFAVLDSQGGEHLPPTPPPSRKMDLSWVPTAAQLCLSLCLSLLSPLPALLQPSARQREGGLRSPSQMTTVLPERAVSAPGSFPSDPGLQEALSAPALSPTPTPSSRC